MRNSQTKIRPYKSIKAPPGTWNREPINDNPNFKRRKQEHWKGDDWSDKPTQGNNRAISEWKAYVVCSTPSLMIFSWLNQVNKQYEVFIKKQIV